MSEKKFVCAKCGRGPGGELKTKSFGGLDVRTPGVTLFKMTIAGAHQFRCSDHLEGTRIKQTKVVVKQE